jgi:hypothetical protein
MDLTNINNDSRKKKISGKERRIREMLRNKISSNLNLDSIDKLSKIPLGEAKNYSSINRAEECSYGRNHKSYMPESSTSLDGSIMQSPRLIKDISSSTSKAI